MVSSELLDKFKKLYQAKFKISLSNEEATQMANDLVNLMRILLKPENQETNSDNSLLERRQDETIPIQSIR